MVAIRYCKIVDKTPKSGATRNSFSGGGGDLLVGGHILPLPHYIISERMRTLC